MTFRLELGEYRPDLAETDANVLAIAKNVQASLNGYIPLNRPTVYSSDALAATPLGMWTAKKIDGTFKTFAATDQTLEELVSQTWTDRTGASGWNATANEYPDATQFGSKFIVCNRDQVLYNVDVDAGTNFATIAGSPQARCVGVVEGHVMCGSTDVNDYGVEWSDTNDETNWTTGNSGAQVFRRGGRPARIIQAAATVIQEEGIQRVVLSAQTGATFEFYEIENAVGTIAPNSVIPFQDSYAYLSRNGFWFRGEPIGHEKITRTFFARASDSEIKWVIGAAHPVRPYFYWIYRETTGGTTYNKGFIYNWALQRWTEIEQDMEFIATAATGNISPDSWSTSPDSEPLSPDDPAWAGGREDIGIINTDDKLAFLANTPMAATIETAEMTVGDAMSKLYQMPGVRRSFIRACRPIIDTTSATMNLRTRERPGDTGTYLAADVSQTTPGYCYFHKAGRLTRFRINVPAGTTWSYASAIDVEANRAGKK